MRDELPDSPTLDRSAWAVRAAGWGALAGAPILLSTLALISARPSTIGAIAMDATWAAFLCGGLAAAAAVLHHRGARRPAALLATFVVLIVAGFAGFLVWLSTRVA